MPGLSLSPGAPETLSAHMPVRFTTPPSCWTSSQATRPRMPRPLHRSATFPKGYTSKLNPLTLKNKRIGLYGPGWLGEELTAETQKLYDRAVKELESQGAIVVTDPFANTEFADFAKSSGSIGIESIVYDMEQYLKRLGPNAPIQSVDELIKKTGETPSALARYPEALKNPGSVPDLSKFTEIRTKYLHIFNDVMDQHKLDALVFPQMYKETPPLHSEDKIADTTVPEINIAGVPLVTVPAGYYKSGSPFSIAFVGKMWSEADLLGMAYDYEQSTKHRVAPTLVAKP